MSRRDKLEQIAEMERRNQMRIDEYIFERQELERKRSRLATSKAIVARSRAAKSFSAGS